MNPYTLSFRNQSIENSFQLHRIHTYQYRFYTLVNLAVLMVLLLNVIQNFWIEQNVFMNYIKIGVIITIFTFNVFTHFQRSYTPKAICYTNFCLAITEVQYSAKFDVFDGFLVGTNTQVLHLLMMLTSPFPFGLMSNLAYAVFKLLIVHIQSGPINPTQITFTIASTLLVAVFIYHIEKDQRELYQFGLKEAQLETIIPRVAKVPFAIFSWDVHHFRSSIQNLSSVISGKQEDQLEELLTKAKTRGVTLKALVHQFMHQKTGSEKLKLHVYLNDEKQKVSLYRFPDLGPFLALTIDKPGSEREARVESAYLQQRLKRHQERLLGLLLKRTETNTKAQLPPHLLSISIVEIKLLYLNQFNLEEFKLKPFLKAFSKFMGRCGYSITLGGDSNIRARSNKILLFVMLAELIKNCDTHYRMQISVELSEKREVVVKLFGLRILDLNCLFQGSLFDKLGQRLTLKTMLQSDPWKQQKKVCTLILLDEPMKGFR